MDGIFPVALTLLATIALAAGLLLPARAMRSEPAAPERASGLAPVPDALLRLGARLIQQSRDRIAPVTRRPLRAQTAEPTWPELAGAGSERLSPGDRQTLLNELVEGEPRAGLGAVFALAATEEERELRPLALRALVAGAYPEGRDVFAEALHSGSEVERSMAIDGLARIGALDELPFAFGDRLEPLAAKAALAFVRSRDRRALESALEGRVDAGRRDAILRLLAGVLE